MRARLVTVSPANGAAHSPPILRKILHGYYVFRRIASSSRGDPRARAMDRYRDQFYADTWQEAAEETGATVVPCGNNFFQIARDGKKICVNRNFSPIDKQVAVLLADDKPATYRVLAEADIPVPPYRVVASNDHGTAVNFLRSSAAAVVVKPAAGTSGGNGVTTNATDASHLTHAMAWAAAFGGKVLIERQLEGETYRLLFLDGELLDCVRRRSPRLVGNGTATIRELVRAENAHRLAAGYKCSQCLLGIDQDMKTMLALQHLQLTGVPAAGREFVVKQVVNENRGAENDTAIDRLCEATVELGRRTLDALGLRFAGIDIITSDPALPLHRTGGAVVDVNACPGFYYHYYKKDGRLPIACHLLRGIFDHDR